jgi:hypothetical protein
MSSHRKQNKRENGQQIPTELPFLLLHRSPVKEQHSHNLLFTSLFFLPEQFQSPLLHTASLLLLPMPKLLSQKDFDTFCQEAVV